MRQEAKKIASLSLVSTLATGALTSVHHLYELGTGALLLALLVVVFPLLTMQWFTRTGSKVAFWMYGLLVAWLVIGFGIADGLWNHVIRTFGYYYVLLPAHGGDAQVVEKTFSLLPPEVGNVLFEATGICTFAAGMVAAYYGVRFMNVRKQFATSTNHNNARGQHV